MLPGIACTGSGVGCHASSQLQRLGDISAVWPPNLTVAISLALHSAHATEKAIVQVQLKQAIVPMQEQFNKYCQAGFEADYANIRVHSSVDNCAINIHRPQHTTAGCLAHCCTPLIHCKPGLMTDSMRSADRLPPPACRWNMYQWIAVLHTLSAKTMLLRRCCWSSCVRPASTWGSRRRARRRHWADAAEAAEGEEGADAVPGGVPWESFSERIIV